MILGFMIKVICHQIMLQLLDFLCFIEVVNFCFVESRVPRRKLWWYHFIHRSKNVDVIACPNVTILNRLSTVSMISSLMYRLWWINRLIKIYRNTCSSGEKIIYEKCIWVKYRYILRRLIRVRIFRLSVPGKLLQGKNRKSWNVVTVLVSD